MRCEQVLPYLAGYAGGDLRPDTTRVVAEHVGGCAACRGEVARLERVRGALVALAAREVAPPPYLLDALLEQAQERTARRILPIVPVPPADVVRVLQENREVIAQAAGAALVAAGAAYALWRALRGARRAAEAAT